MFACRPTPVTQDFPWVMRTALRVFYLASTNLVGRSAAARTLAQALRLAGNLREAQAFPPRLLV